MNPAHHRHGPARAGSESVAGDGVAPSMLLWVLYGTSGLVSLGYQTVWLRVFVDRFGATNLTFVAVLVAFMTGLAAGAAAAPWLYRRWSGSQRRSLRAYGVLELAVSVTTGLTVVLVLTPLSVWVPEPAYVADGAMFTRAIGYQIAVLVACGLCVFIPSFAMGLTFPWLCRCFAHCQRVPAALYAANTLGASTGVLVTQLVLLPWVGYAMALVVLVALNALVAAVAWLAPGALSGRPVSRTPCSSRHRPDGAPTAAWPPGALVAAAILAGLATGVLEGDLVKRVWLLGTTTSAAMVFVSFWAILGIFIGAWLVGARRIEGRRSVLLLAAVGMGLYVATWWLGYPLKAWLEGLHAGAGLSVGDAAIRGALAFALDPLHALVVTAVFALPAMILLSTVLPRVCNEGQRRGTGVAWLYALNTAAFCTGLIVAGWLAPSVNVFYSLNLAHWLLGALALGAVLLGMLDGWRTAAVVAVVGALVAVVAVPRGLDRTLLDPRRAERTLPAWAMRSNAAHTTWVVAHPAGRRLYFDGHPMSGTSRGAQTYMRLMAHVPLLAQRAPRRALLIGFGVGNTAAAIARHETLERIDVAELNHQVIATANEFEATNDGVVGDPRLHVYHDDGRSYLALANARYDLITTEPPPPIQHGIHRLYSVEFYRACRERLTETGLVSQWLPVSQLPTEAIRRMVASFAAVFPDYVVMSGAGTDLLLIGGRGRVDMTVLQERFASEAPVRADLARLGITDWPRLATRFIGTADSLGAGMVSARRVRDARNDLGFIRYAPLSAESPPFRYRSTREDYGGALPLPARVAWQVPDFPFHVVGAPADASPAVRTLWRRQHPASRAYDAAMARGDRAGAERIASAELDFQPAQPRWVMELGRHAFARRDAPGAIAHFEALHRLVDPTPESLVLLAGSRAAAGQWGNALVDIRALLALSGEGPYAVRGALLEGRIHEQLGNVEQATRAYRQALAGDQTATEATDGLRRLGRLEP